MYVFLVSKYDSKTPDPFSVETLIFLCCELPHLLELGGQIVLFKLTVNYLHNVTFH